MHLAAYFSGKAPAALIDGDANSSATAWADRSENLPFTVVDPRQTAKAARQHEHLIIDTQARPSREDLRALVEGCDLLIIPSTPDAMSLDALMLTVDTLRQLQAQQYRILLTITPPRPSRDAEEARAMLTEEGLPVFAGGIRRLVAFQRAALSGLLVHQVNGDPRAKFGWDDYQGIGKEIEL